MKNITVTISDKGYHAARVWAAEHRTSLSKTVAVILDNLPYIPLAAGAFPAGKSSATTQNERVKK
jgi:hypothetical protein